jgi:hypothetical protein
VNRLAVALLCALGLASCGGEEKRPAPQGDPVERFVRYYQDVGFFAGQDPHRTAARIARSYRRRWGEEPDVTGGLGVLEVLAYDKDRVWFALGDRRETLITDGKDDFLDLCIIDDLNALIADAGRQFVVYNRDLGQEAFIVAITDRERSLLEQRGWTFATPC